MKINEKQFHGMNAQAKTKTLERIRLGVIIRTKILKMMKQTLWESLIDPGHIFRIVALRKKLKMFGKSCGADELNHKELVAQSTADEFVVDHLIAAVIALPKSIARLEFDWSSISNQVRKFTF